MRSSIAQALPVLFVVTSGLACGGPNEPPDEPACVPSMPSAALAPPAGARPGEPYRWLSRNWQSPLGVTIRTYGLAIDGVPVFARHQVEVYDSHGQLAYRTGSGDAVLAQLRGRGPAAWAAWRHPLAALSAGDTRSHPLVRATQRPVWHYAQGALVPAVLTERLNLLDEAPLGEVIVRDAESGAELARRPTLYELTDPEYLVYAQDDGRPLASPLGNTLPHPSGVPDGRVPPPVPQQLRRQSAAVAALPDPWVAASSNQTRGNNVVAFFDSLLDSSGKLVELSDSAGKNTPEYGPEPDRAGGDFFATATGDRFAFSYDPTKTASEYFQDGAPGTTAPPPDRGNVALNAKIVAAFYTANWLHDFFYRAGFDEVAGNAQRSNLGRGGADCDPLIVHVGFYTTFTFPAREGQSPVLDMGLNSRSASRRDSAVDFTVLAHEWGHTLIGRLAGGTANDDALGTLQGMALHEGIADFVGILVSVPGVDALGTYAVGSYTNLDYIERRPALPAGEAPSDAMYYGIRRYPYSLDLHKNPLTFRHLAEPPPTNLPFYNWKGRGPLLSEPHTAGEVFSQALFQCFGNIVAAHPGADFEGLRARMAQYLVAGLAAFPDHPSFLDARNAFLDVIRLASAAADYPACRAGFAARGMGADAIGPDRDFAGSTTTPLPPYDPAQIVESFLDRDRAMRLISSSFAADAVRVELRNTGLIDLAVSSLEITAAVPAAVVFPNGARIDLGRLAPEQATTATFAATVNACLLPPHPTQPGFQLFDYTVKATSPGTDEVIREATYHVAVPAPTGPCP